MRLRAQLSSAHALGHAMAAFRRSIVAPTRTHRQQHDVAAAIARVRAPEDRITAIMTMPPMKLEDGARRDRQSEVETR